MHIPPPQFTAQQKDFVKRFLNGAGKRYLYGRTAEAASIAALVPIDGYIDDFTLDTSYQGLPCIKLKSLPEGAMVVSTVVQAHANKALANLRQANVAHLDYFAFQVLSGLPVRDIPYWEGAQAHFEANENSYRAVYDGLVDQESKDVFSRIMAFRLNKDHSQMAPFQAKLEEMYFEPFVKLPSNAVFFDVGAFDGLNSDQFARRFPSFHRAVLFEPIAPQAEALRAKYAGDPRFDVCEIALSDQRANLFFEVDSTASHLSQKETGIKVQADRLDAVVNRLSLTPDFIKMDIEGAEMAALSGAEQVIRDHKPHMAISVYHRASHLTEAFHILKRLNPSYMFRLRHYTEGYTETVLFACPA